jgi:tetratricopeptide (TPR) repeat protein
MCRFCHLDRRRAQTSFHLWTASYSLSSTVSSPAFLRLFQSLLGPLYGQHLLFSQGPEHPDVAQSLNNLAWLYYAQGQYAKAKPLFQRSLAIGETALGPEHPNVATSLNNLASLYHAQGQYAKAEPLYQRSLAISEKALGPEHPDVANSLNNLAELYQAQGQYAKAEATKARGKAISGH